MDKLVGSVSHSTHIDGLLNGLGPLLWSHRQLGALHGEEVLLLLLARQRRVDPRHLQLGLRRRRLLVVGGLVLLLLLLLVRDHHRRHRVRPLLPRPLLLRPPHLPAGALFRRSDQHHGVNKKKEHGQRNTVTRYGDWG
jgi:hypothetical protein